jgi:multicomponent Na+:H+ antiporter subunit B
MARLRDNYERSLYARFRRWLSGGQDALDRDLTGSLSEKAAPNAAHTNAAHLEREKEWEAYDSSEQEKEQQAYDRIHLWSKTRGSKLMKWLYAVLAVVIGLSIIMTLLVTVSNLPSFGHEENPLNNEVSKRYLEKGLEEGGATNLVANMILDYRAFDTLGESNVLFIAVCSVIILLRVSQEKKQDGTASLEKQDAEADDRQFEPKNDMVLQKAASFLVPLIFLFGVYIMLNGHLSPGGGFSGGAVTGAGLILYLNAFGFKRTEQFFTFKTFKAVSFCALSFYALSKAYSFYTGANGLESGIGVGTPGAILSAGLILPLNIAVGLVVACTMYAFYTLFRKGDM